MDVEIYVKVWSAELKHSGMNHTQLKILNKGIFFASNPSYHEKQNRWTFYGGLL